MLKNTSNYLYVLFILSVLISIGCDEKTIDPIEDDSGIFSFYGGIQVGESPNYVRIRDLNEQFLADLSDFNGNVTFEDLSTGEVTTLRDSVVNFNAGYTHNFIIEEEIKPDNAYLLRAERSDGQVVQSRATTPGITYVRTEPADLTEDIHCETPIRFRFGNVIEPEFVRMDVSVTFGSERSSTLSIFLQFFERIEGEDAMEITLSPRNLLVEIFPEFVPDIPPTSPLFDPFKFAPGVNCKDLDSDLMRITFTHFGDEWAGARPFILGLIDPESGDVENGLGFFGGFYRDTIDIILVNEPPQDEN